jgi:hypothetical protein
LSISNFVFVIDHNLYSSPLKINKMKKQITVMLTVFASICLLSCQKETIIPQEGSNHVATGSSNANQMSKMFEGGVPFKGNFTTSNVMLQPPPNLIQQVSGLGTASHLGESSFEGISHVTVTSQPPFAVNGTRTITASNGDQLFTSFTGASTPVVEGLNGATLQETITGGTGRFANASGSFISVVRNNWITSSFRIDFDGHIKY